jgi:ribosomal protein S17
LYGKIMRSDSCVKDHDENETAGVGDRDRIEETRPLSKDKRFRLVEIIERRASFL